MAFPEEIVSEISWHLDRFAEPGERGFVFVGPKGGKLRRSDFHKSVWAKARAAVGMPEFHFHDLRHATRDRDQAIAKALGTFVREVRDASGESASGREQGEQGA